MKTNTIMIVVTLEEREDGGIRVSSRDLRGLHLSGRNREHVWSMIGPAIQTLLERNHNVRVRHVQPAVGWNDACKVLPNDIEVRVLSGSPESQTTFVAELEAA